MWIIPGRTRGLENLYLGVASPDLRLGLKFQPVPLLQEPASGRLAPAPDPFQVVYLGFSLMSSEQF